MLRVVQCAIVVQAISSFIEAVQLSVARLSRAPSFGQPQDAFAPDRTVKPRSASCPPPVSLSLLKSLCLCSNPCLFSSHQPPFPGTTFNRRLCLCMGLLPTLASGICTVGRPPPRAPRHHWPLSPSPVRHSPCDDEGVGLQAQVYSLSPSVAPCC